MIVVNFNNCDPQPQDWIGIYVDGTTVAFSENKERVSDDYIDWAFTYGEQECVDSPSTYSFAFAANYKNYLRGFTLRAYLIRNTPNGPPFEVVAKSDSFVPTQVC